MGRQRPEGYEFQAKNGYWYVKQNGEFRLKHHIIAEQTLGRPVDAKIHRVLFKDNDRTNLDPDNIQVVDKIMTKEKRAEVIRAKIRVLEDELKDLEG